MVSIESVSNSLDLNQLIRSVGDAVVVADVQGLIALWNPASTRIFGYSEAEALGRSLDLITPERQRNRHWGGFYQTMQTGYTRYGTEVLRVPAIHKDGRSLSIAFTVGLLFDDHRNVTGIAAVIRDETTRWLEERQVRRRLAEFESGVAGVAKP